MKVIYNDGHVGEIPQEEELHVIRHTAAHIMAQAILRLHPQAKFAYGPATERGFYYDVDLGEEKLTDEDLAAIEQEMKKICKENLPIKAYALPREEAIALMESRGEIYKVEHIGDLREDAVITFYQQGDYIDMCVGPTSPIPRPSRPSRSPSSPAPTGRTIKTTRCSPGSTVSPSGIRRSWRNISI